MAAWRAPGAVFQGVDTHHGRRRPTNLKLAWGGPSLRPSAHSAKPAWVVRGQGSKSWDRQPWGAPNRRSHQRERDKADGPLPQQGEGDGRAREAAPRRRRQLKREEPPLTLSRSDFSMGRPPWLISRSATVRDLHLVGVPVEFERCGDRPVDVLLEADAAGRQSFFVR